MSETKLSYSIDEAVLAAGIGRTLLYEEIKRGNLITRKCGRRTLILRSDLETWLAMLPQSQVVPPASANSDD